MIILTSFIQYIMQCIINNRWGGVIDRVLNENSECMAKQLEEKDLISHKSVNDILTEFYEEHLLFGNGSEVLARSLESMGIMNLDNGNWDAEYDILGYLPPCPKCRAKMRYCYNADLLQCPECGYVVEGIAYPYHEMPPKDEIKESDYSHLE